MYESKHYKLFFIIPIALLLISLYFIPHIQLDSSLKGGISVTLQTNAIINTKNLTNAINSKLPGAQASIAKAPGGVSVTIVSNTSIANANNYLLAAYSDYQNYTQATFKIAGIQNALANEPNNKTLASMLSSLQNNQSAALKSLNLSVSNEFLSLKGITNTTYNATSPSSMISSATNAMNNANLNYKNKVISVLRSLVPFSDYSYETVTATLGAYFLSQLQEIVIVAFILIAIVVFIIFRTVVPSIAVVFGAANDIIVALGAMGLFGIPLGIASIGGLLMLIGYAMDTDVLTSIRILKRNEGTAEERAHSSMKTGMTMTATAIMVFAILFIISYISFIQTYYEIAGVVLAGLVGDIFTTWFGDTVLVLWYKKRKEGIK